MPKYYVSLEYINVEKELVPGYYYVNSEGYYQADNIKELKQILIDLVEDNIYNSKDWIENQVKPLVAKISDKIHVSYYDKRYTAEKFAEDKEGNYITLVRAEASRITKNEALACIEVQNPKWVLRQSKKAR